MVRLSIWTVILMVLLRLAIGWHFLFEGYQKIRSHDIGTTETNKPWTAEGYFRVAEGPARDFLVEQFGDPDEETLQRLQLLTLPDVADLHPGRIPVAIANEWTEYLMQFSNFYKLGNDEKEKAKERVEVEKKKLVKWLVEGKKTIKRTSPSGGPATEVEISIPDRILEYQFKVRELRDIFDKRLIALGRDVEKRVPQMRSELGTYRKEFQDDLADFTTKMKNSLAELLQTRFSGFYVKKDAKAEDRDIDNRLLRMLKPTQSEVKFGNEQSAMHALLSDQWDAYLEFVREFHPKFDEAEATRRMAEAKRRYVRFILDRDQFSDQPSPTATVAPRLREYEQAEAELGKLREAKPEAKSPGATANRELTQLRTDQKKLRDYLRTLLDQDEYSNNPASAAESARVLKEYEGLTQKINEIVGNLPASTTPATGTEAKLLATLKAHRDRFIADIEAQTDVMKGMVGEGLPADIAKGYAPSLPLEKKKSWLQTADKITMWVITLSGACLLLGLFTRLACLLAAGFLIMTYLAHPAFPWLPAPPTNEGNYVFVNKNIIEALALLMLATTRSGRWLGLDAWISGFFSMFRGKGDSKPAAKTTARAPRETARGVVAEDVSNLPAIDPSISTERRRKE